MKKSILATAMLAPLFAAANPSASSAPPPAETAWPSRPLNDLAAVERALNSGARVSAAIDLSACTPLGSSRPTTVQGGLVINSYNIQDGTLSFSDAHFTVSPAGATPIMQFLRYTLAASGAVTVGAYVFGVPAYTLVSQASYACSVGHGLNFNEAL